MIHVNYAKFLRKSFKPNTSERLLLYYFSTETKNSETIKDSSLLKQVLTSLVVFFRSSRPDVFCKKGVLRNFLEGLRPGALLKICSVFLWMCFPVNFAKFLRTPLLTQNRLLLIFAVQFVKIFFCYKPMIVRRKFEHATEAVAQRCSVKNLFLEISQNSQENTCARVPFLIKLQV